MKITKFVHSCLLVEMPEPVSRTVLFDPGVMSEEVLAGHNFEFLDDIIITHEHSDHLSMPCVKRLVEQFPDVSITASQSVVNQLQSEGISASSQESEGIVFFEAPHEHGEPLLTKYPEQIGVHYLDTLTHPGDCHTFKETKAILALPITAPWGSTVRAVNLALELKPKYILPIHDWHYRDEARTQTYNNLEQFFAGKGIAFVKLETGEPVVLDV